MSWKFHNESPIYLQLMEKIKISIVNGHYPSGSRLPAVRDLAVEAGVNPNTVQRAFAELEREGLVQSDRTNGRFVSEDQEMIGKIREELCDRYIREVYRSLSELGLEEEEIRKRISSWEEV